MAVVNRGGRDALTMYRITGRYAQGAVAQVECRLSTGRTHQIRVHLASLGHPLLGDTQYGGRVLGDAHRQMLHAHRLRFDDPSTDIGMSCVAPVPKDMRKVLEGIQWR